LEVDTCATYKPHKEACIQLEFDHHNTRRLYSAGYDNTVRYLDLDSLEFCTVYDNQHALQIASMAVDPHRHDTVWCGTMDGTILCIDGRKQHDTKETYDVATNKLGSIQVHPLNTFEVMTASRDRHVYVWDIRQITAPLTEFSHDRSVTAAYWDSTGKRVSSISHDNTIRLFDYTDTLVETIRIPHNNQTGRWLTMFRPRWNNSVIVCGSMDKQLDVYCGMTGELLQTLQDSRLTAVPAVCQWHPSGKWIVGANASGRICLWGE
jgi:WD40 repeat protein